MNERFEVTMNVKSFNDLQPYASTVPTLASVFAEVTDENVYAQGRGQRVRLWVSREALEELCRLVNVVLEESGNEFRATSTAGDNNGRRLVREKMRRFNNLNKRLSAL